MNAQLSNGARSLVFSLSYPLILYFVYVSSEGSGETSQLSNGARSVVIALSYPLILYFVFASSEGSGETAVIHSLP